MRVPWRARRSARNGPSQGLSYDACARSAETSILGSANVLDFHRHRLGALPAVGGFLIFHSYPDPDRIDVKRYAYRPQGLVAIGTASVVFLLATVFFSFAQVNTGHVGVVRTFGRISGQINPGISLIAPWQSYDSVNVQVQKQTFETSRRSRRRPRASRSRRRSTTPSSPRTRAA